MNEIQTIQEYYDYLMDMLTNLQDELWQTKYDIIDNDFESARKSINDCINTIDQLIGDV